MRFLIDAQLPPGLCEWLKERGHEAVHVYEIGLGHASDAVIVDYAIREEVVILFKDEDFVFLRLPDRFALVWFRCGNATNRALIDWLGSRWNQAERLLDQGERLIELR